MHPPSRDTITTTIRFLGHNYTIHYRWTVALAEEAQAIEEELGQCEGAARVIAAAVVSWDMRGENGRHLPLTLDAIYATPCDRINAVYWGMVNDARRFERAKASPTLARVIGEQERRLHNNQRRGKRRK